VALVDYWIDSVLPNGLRVLLHPVPRMRTVTWGVFVSHGVKDEIKENNGISHFLEHVVFNAQYQASSDLADLIAHGSVAEAFTTKEYTQFSVTTLPRDSAMAVRGLGGLLRNASFHIDLVERERCIIIEELKRFLASERFLDESLENALFGDRTLGLYTLGTHATVTSFQPASLEARYQSFYGPLRTTVVGYGNLEGPEALDIVSNVLGDWDPNAIWVPSPTFEDTPRVKGIKGADNSRVHLRLGFRGPGLGSLERPSISLLADALGLGVGSRLWRRLRVERQLAYDIQAMPVSYGPAGYLKILLSCDRTNVGEALGLILETIAELQDGLEPEELDRCRTIRCTELLRQADDSRRMLSVVGRFAVNGMTFLVDSEIHRFRQVTKESTARAARQFLTGDTLGLVAYGLSTEELLEFLV